MNDATVTSDLKDRVRGVIMQSFGLPAGERASDLRMGSVPRWDSMGHMQLVMELENAFGITFPAYALADLVDVESIARAIQEQKG